MAMRGQSGQDMLANLRTISSHAGTGRVLRFALLASIAAATEAFGLVLIVPLLAALGGTGDTNLGLPDWPLATLLAMFVGLVALRSLADYLRGMAAFGLQVSVVDGLRRRAVSALLSAEWRALSAMRQSANRALIITSVDRVGEAVGHLAALARNAAAVLALIAAAFVLSPPFALGCILAGMLALFLLAGVRRHARRLGSALSDSYEAIHLRLEETLSALRLVKSFGRETREAERVNAAFRDLRGTESRYLRESAVARALLQTAAALVIALTVWLAVERWDVAPAYLLAFAALAVRGIPLLEALQASWQGWHHTSPGLAESERLIAVAEGDEEAPAERTAPMRENIALECAAVHFSKGREAIDEVTLAIPRGAYAAITGPSGAGKSTLADLLGGLISPDAGSVLLDGKPLSGGLRNGWRARVAYVQQEPVLFTGTIRENLLWARGDVSETDIERALDQAAASFVHELPHGLDEVLGEGGRNLSGGERQRIALARALLCDPDLLILDEATSSVDAGNERIIADAVAALAGERTILVIGHKGSLVDGAALRFHLRDGRLMEA